jgi:hypothetical protein
LFILLNNQKWRVGFVFGERGRSPKIIFTRTKREMGASNTKQALEQQTQPLMMDQLQLDICISSPSP